MENTETVRQTNYTIAEGYELPSKGLIYNVPVNAHVELRSMTARDEMKRLSPSTTQFKVLADIIEGCMIEKPAVHVYDMALGDYEYLLHKLRVVTYGDEYKIALRCPHCKEEVNTVMHLDDLETKEFDKEKFDELKTFTLPRSGHTVSIRFQTPHMLDDAESRVKELRRKFKNTDMQFDLLVLLQQVIESVDGEVLEPTKLETFINKLPAMDMTKIINKLDELNACFGLITSFVADCPACGGEIPASFLFGPEFFRPTNI